MILSCVRRAIVGALCGALLLGVSGGAGTTVPITIERGVIFVHGELDAAGPLLFVFDPGASDFMTTYASSQLRGRAAKELRVGSARVPVAMDVAPGDPNQLVPNHDPSRGTIAGSVGPAMLQQYAVTLNYATSTMTLTPFEAFIPSANASKLPFTLDENGLPVVDGSVDSTAARFEVDLRAPISLLFRPFLQRSGVGVRYANAPVAKQSGTRVAHAIGTIAIGDRRLNSVPIWFSNESSGKFALPSVAGLLGNDVWSNFVVTLDYRNRAVYVAALGDENERRGAMFRADAAHRGVYESQAPRLAAVAWRFHTSGRIFSSPTFHDGKVFVGSADHRLYAVRASDGTELWHVATKGAVNSSPAVADGAVYFASLDGNVYAVNEADGTERWRFHGGGERRFSAPGIHGLQPKTEVMPDPFDVFLSSPAVWNGVVYIGSGDHNVYALDSQTGRLRWKFTTGNVVHASPAVSGGIVYVGSWDRYLYALDARTGALRWKFATGDDRDIYNQVGIAGSAAVAGGIVYFGCRDSHFYALDARTGTLRWKRDEHGSWVVASPAIAAGMVFYTTSDERKFYAVDARDGSVRFTIPYGTFAYSSPSIAGGVAYYGSFDGRLYAVDVTAGRVVGEFSTDASARNLPNHLDRSGNVDLDSFYNDSTLDAAIVGLDRIYALGSLVGSPALADGTLFIGSTEGTLYAIR